ncbi:PMT family glycosyltransferase, 4-amino-4-deoxy-L-arabinose transferase [Chthonomonas calidirosea]|uniref:ArnT family glycosyltransferase n=1 Tax=Chthonomonas calidirosea TaxID=454171 RepID=UPI0006DD4833|nr:glycosyltransferase family 39 protein [Chthonomonas calidirosea]CEK14090.1 PMT family glycosyltransferase, 4-amino-4-deoxy-L-arabinose transferase [Chthonomonas calidirosea]CEK14092.1 PMT family glycosyltransferase, 4-amino-4-deoxy-L-arabinose transferase [Chthonomonas calidirosea]
MTTSRPLLSHRVALHLPLLILLFIYLCGALIHAWLVPIGQTGYQDAPDENAHAQYVRTLSLGHLPSFRDWQNDATKQNYEWHQPPLYYLLALPFYRMGYRAVRLLSIFCGAIVIVLTYLVGRNLFPDRDLLAFLGAGIVALLPGHIMLTSVINNDALLEVWFAAAFLAMVVSLREGLTLSRSCWIGLSLGLGLITKVTAILLIPVFLFFLWLMHLSGQQTRKLVISAAVVSCMSLLVAGWWYIRNVIVYGELFPLKEFSQTFAGTAQASVVAQHLGGWGSYWWHSLLWSFMSFWAVFGTPKLAAQGIPAYLPGTVYLLTALISLMMVVGLARVHLRRKGFATYQIHGIWLLMASVGIVGIAFIVFLSHYFQVQGRYMYPVILPLGILMSLGWWGIWRDILPERYLKVACYLLLALLGALSLILLGAIQSANAPTF